MVDNSEIGGINSESGNPPKIGVQTPSLEDQNAAFAGVAPNTETSFWNINPVSSETAADEPDDIKVLKVQEWLESLDNPPESGNHQSSE